MNFRFLSVGFLLITSALFAQTGGLSIRPAVEVVFPTAAGRVHQLQSSTDLDQWRDLDGFVLGSGRPIEKLVAAAHTTRFFRVQDSVFTNISADLENIRVARNVPALAAVLVRSNRIAAMGVTGLRRFGTNVPVTPLDRWHHGSITKSMTATLAGVLVEDGLISWTNRMADSFPSLAARMHPAWRNVTLEQLLRHRGGAPDQPWLGSRGLWTALWNHPGTPTQVRQYWLETVATNAPQNTNGAFIYSNTGYVFAGMMLENAAGQDWETLITRRLFEPLGMASAGFGVPATPRFVDQPLGHQWTAGRPAAIVPGPDSDNPAALGPAGTVHCALLDLAKYAAMHVAGARGATGLLLRPETFARLHTPAAGQDYAFGWNSTSRPWGGGTVLNHTGSNVQWLSNVWLVPNKDAALIVLTNIGDNVGQTAFNTTDEVVGLLIQRFLN
jgi:CubicO group peptidase (beta-lactamase class C family)